MRLFHNNAQQLCQLARLRRRDARAAQLGPFQGNALDVAGGKVLPRKGRVQKLRARKAAFPKGEHGAPPQATYRMFGPSAPRTARYTDVSNIACRARWLAECLPPSCSVRDHSRAHWAACANMRPLKPVPALRDAALYTFSNTRGTPSR